MWVTLCIKGWFCDIDGAKVWHFMNNWGYVVNHDLTVFIALKEEQLSSVFVIVCVNGRYWDFLINLVVFQHGDKCLVHGVLLHRRWGPDDPNA